MAKDKKSKGGRPTVMTEAVIGKLHNAFAIGATDAEACRFAGIHIDTYYDHKKKNLTFSEGIDAMKDRLPLAAKSKLAELVKAGDKQTVHWYLERKCRQEFATHTEVDLSSKGEKIGFNMVVQK